MELEYCHVVDSDPPMVKTNLISAAMLSLDVMDVVVLLVFDIPIVLVMVLVTGVVPRVLSMLKMSFSVSLN